MHGRLLLRSTFVVALMAAVPALGQDAASPAPARQALMVQCKSDLATYCSDVTPGNGAVKACVKENFRRFSSPCKAALRDAMMAKRQ